MADKKNEVLHERHVVAITSTTVHNRCLKILKQGPHHSLLKTAETSAAIAVDLNVELGYNDVIL
ncbi:hypothetical protein T4B_736 [Trichinella pseudospiralis]|uniref:Uncharacterized protein n=1 Tax=Trichinella pseudospiralis TaxID=6337 RepID=A0A0V1JFZ8_TRIPS|nr:hypothetical protein T4A_4407 [Trichinella pseudospiralis]KRZ33888.1 hypothetical protein T4B_736 [Trichinella pseudospiralis]KRZ42701.1 hypothetical protein T4C_1221 [Trichinella pseudospiralis]